MHKKTPLNNHLFKDERSRVTTLIHFSLTTKTLSAAPHSLSL